MISEKEAIKMLKSGKTVTCKFSPKSVTIVSNEQELMRLKKLHLEGIQGFDLYDNNQKLSVPKKATEVSIDDAITKLANYELLYFKTIDSTKEVSSYDELINLCRSSKIRGLNFVIYEIQ